MKNQMMAWKNRNLNEGVSGGFSSEAVGSGFSGRKLRDECCQLMVLIVRHLPRIDVSQEHCSSQSANQSQF